MKKGKEDRRTALEEERLAILEAAGAVARRLQADPNATLSHAEGMTLVRSTNAAVLTLLGLFDAWVKRSYDASGNLAYVQAAMQLHHIIGIDLAIAHTAPKPVKKSAKKKAKAKR